MRLPMKSELNIPDFRDSNGNWVRSVNYNDGEFNIQKTTRAGCAWNAICRRCLPDGAVWKTIPTYVGTSNGFANFQEFAEWCQDEYGYLNKEVNGKFWSLDKDILILGNKEYSSDKCMFVPKRINGLFTSREAERGDYALGVYKKRGKFVGEGSGGTGQPKIRLGIYDTEIEAHQAWQKYKIARVKSYISHELGSKLIGALENRIYLIENDLNSDRFTVEI